MKILKNGARQLLRKTADGATRDGNTRIAIWINLILVTITALQFFALMYSNAISAKAANAAIDAANSAIKSNELSRQTLIADQRPWVTVNVEPAGPLIWMNGGFQVSYLFTIKNIGKSPALNVTNLAAVNLDRTSDLSKEQAILSKIQDGGLSIDALNLMPEEERKIINHQQVDVAQVGRAVDPKLIIPVLIGTIEYRTQFDRTIHHTGYIYEIGFWSPEKNITVTAMRPVLDGNIPTERVRIRRHPFQDALLD
jgi:hypothetical protein